MSIPGRLTVASDGRLTGPANLAWNDPWPCSNGSWGSGAMSGVLMHTMEGDLPGTVQWFNSITSQASAHFGIAQDGAIHQFGPVGKGWIAWHAAAANPSWYGIEHADGGNPANPLTAAQSAASAQLLECLSAFAGFPLQVSDSPSVKGYGWHGMGGAAFGGHYGCPGDARKAQRSAIIALAQQIRSGAAGPPPPGVREWTTAGQDSIGQLAASSRADVATVLRLTAEHAPGGWQPELAAYINGVFAGTVSPSAHAPAGLRLYLPA